VLLVQGGNYKELALESVEGRFRVSMKPHIYNQSRAEYVFDNIIVNIQGLRERGSVSFPMKTLFSEPCEADGLFWGNVS
jgi:hypothetical protein